MGDFVSIKIKNVISKTETFETRYEAEKYLFLFKRTIEIIKTVIAPSSINVPIIELESVLLK